MAVKHPKLQGNHCDTEQKGHFFYFFMPKH